MNTIRCCAVKTPLGPVYLAAGGRGLVEVGLGGSAAGFRRLLRKKYRAEILEDPSRLNGITSQVREYLAGRRRRFAVKLDWTNVPAFRARVLHAAMRIPYGETRTYGELARSIGKPSAARAVGQALGANPFALVVPCHRVVAGDGSLGGFSAAGGVSIKKRLLQMERK